MNKTDLTAKAQTTINASSEKVWESLTDPKMIKEYMFGTNVSSDREKGSPIIWKGEMNNKKYEDKGEILEIVPNKILKYTHFSPISGQPDKPENYHTVAIALNEEKNKTSLTLTQDHNDSEKARSEPEKSWNGMMESLKKFFEK